MGKQNRWWRLPGDFALSLPPTRSVSSSPLVSLKRCFKALLRQIGLATTLMTTKESCRLTSSSRSSPQDGARPLHGLQQLGWMSPTLNSLCTNCNSVRRTCNLGVVVHFNLEKNQRGYQTSKNPIYNHIYVKKTLYGSAPPFVAFS